MTTNDAPVTVEQCDREAAADIASAFNRHILESGIWTGVQDHHRIVQRIARHRLAALASAPAQSAVLAFVRRVAAMVGDELDAHASVELRDAARAALASAPAGKLDRDFTARRIKELMDEGDGFWTACSGCQEGVDGYVSERDYPFDPLFRCQPGGGCSECGGIGVLWDDGRGYDDITDDEKPVSAPAGDGVVAGPHHPWWDAAIDADDRTPHLVGCSGKVSDTVHGWQPCSCYRSQRAMIRFAAALARPRAAVGEREA